jgi:elongation factor P
MISVTDLRKGVTFEMDGELYKVLDYQHNKPGRGNATIRTRLRNLRSGSNVDRTFQSGDRVQDVRLDRRTVQFLYSDGEFYHFMDTESYEQPILGTDILGDAANYLVDGLNLELSLYDSEPIDVELPVTVDMRINKTEMAIKGDTATGATKDATTETGLVVRVPLFVSEGDTIRVDTRTGAYLTRV